MFYRVLLHLPVVFKLCSKMEVAKLSCKLRVKKEPVSKNFPWLETFDNEAKQNMTSPEVKLSHVLKLLTTLERLVS